MRKEPTMNTRSNGLLWVTGLGLCCALGACSGVEPSSDSDSTETLGTSVEAASGAHVARLVDANGAASGTVAFARAGNRVAVVASVRGLAPASDFHGFHIHANDNAANGTGCVGPTFASADGHFNPTGGTHGDHAGDMPVLLAMADGTAAATFLTDSFTIDAVVGRAVIVHAGRNNYGNVPVGANPDQYTPNSPAATALTESTGNAGARLLCGVIE
jgi:Cu-Zn family superoxide dismutase